MLVVYKMSRRLDTSAAIKLLGEDKLREELDKNVWYLQSIDITELNPVERFPIIKCHNFTRFITTGNPIEYLLFNNVDFFRDIVTKSVLTFDPTKFTDLDHYIVWLKEKLGDEPGIPIDVAEIIWSSIKNDLTYAQIINLFQQYDYFTLILFDKDLKQIFSTHETTNSFLNQWFPR